MRKTLAALTLAAALAAPAVALAATVDASLIPDGTYSGKVEKVIDAKHVLVKLENGMESNLASDRPNVDFSKLSANDSIKMSIIKGEIRVYAKL